MHLVTERARLVVKSPERSEGHCGTEPQVGDVRERCWELHGNGPGGWFDHTGGFSYLYGANLLLLFVRGRRRMKEAGKVKVSEEAND